MRSPPQIRLLLDGRRLHLQDGPIDHVIQAFGSPGAIRDAYQAAARRFAGVLDELCEELTELRAPASPASSRLAGPIARKMRGAVAPFAAAAFITPMAAVAGAVAEDILACMCGAAELERAFVNNGGDIAFHCAPGECFTVGMVDRPDRPSLFGRVVIAAEDPVRGVATSGWRGRSFSLGIADSVTILAGSASAADAAATVVANSVDLPGHPAVQRVPAREIDPDSDLGDRLVTRAVGPLDASEIATALGSGSACAQRLIERGLIVGAALQLQGRTIIAGAVPSLGPATASSAKRPFYLTEIHAHA